MRQTLNKTVEVHREQDNKSPFVLIPAEQSPLWKARSEKAKNQMQRNLKKCTTINKFVLFGYDKIFLDFVQRSRIGGRKLVL